MGVGGQRHAPAALPPGKRPGTHCIGGWVGPRVGLDGCSPFEYLKSNPKLNSVKDQTSVNNGHADTDELVSLCRGMVSAALWISDTL
jgi:hypothetical protein